MVGYWDVAPVLLAFVLLAIRSAGVRVFTLGPILAFALQVIRAGLRPYVREAAIFTVVAVTPLEERADFLRLLFLLGLFRRGSLDSLAFAGAGLGFLTV